MQLLALVASVVGPRFVQGAICEASSFVADASYVKEGDTFGDVKAKLGEDCKDEGYSVDFCNEVLPALLDKLFKDKEDDALFDESHCSQLQGLLGEHWETQRVLEEDPQDWALMQGLIAEHLQHQQALRERAALLGNALLGNSTRAHGRSLEGSVDNKKCVQWRRNLKSDAACSVHWADLKAKCEVCWHCSGNGNCVDFTFHENSGKPECAKGTTMSCATTTSTTTPQALSLDKLSVKEQNQISAAVTHLMSWVNLMSR